MKKYYLQQYKTFRPSELRKRASLIGTRIRKLDPKQKILLTSKMIYHNE